MFRDENGNSWSWGKFFTAVTIAVAVIALTVATVGAAAGAAGLVAGAYYGATASAIAVGAVYSAAVVTVIGVAAFAAAEVTEVYTGYNFMGFLGSTYDPIKFGLYMIPYMFGLMGQYAPPKNNVTITSGTSRPSDSGYGQPNSIYEQKTPYGSNYTYYDSDGRVYMRVDYGKPHYIKEYGGYYSPHMHEFQWNQSPDGEWHVNKGPEHPYYD